MKHYTDTIPHDLAEKLKEKGMPIEKEGNNIWCPPYAACFDWLMSKGYDVEVYLSMTKTSKDGAIQRLYAWIVNAPNQVNEATSRDAEYFTWHEAADAAIKKALTLI